MKKLFLALLLIQGILNTDTCLSQWVTQASGTTTYMYSTHFENALTGWITGSTAVIRKTTDGGLNWIGQSSGQPFGALQSVFFIDPNTGWIVGDQVYSNTLILKTTDSGNNWVLQPGGSSRIFYSCYFLNSLTGWAVGMSTTTYTGLIVNTTDGGNTWTQQQSGSTDRLFSCYFLNNSIGWAGGVNSFVKTSNGGMTWDVITTAFTANGLYFTDALTGYMAENSSKVCKTTDGGLTWNVSYSGNGTMRSVFFANPATGWACGLMGKIVKTSDAGASWSVQTTNVTQDLNSIYFITPLLGYATGAGGVILKTTNGGEPITNTLTIHRYNINKPILLGYITLDTINIITNNPAVGFVKDINVSLDTIVNNYDGELEISLIHLGITDTIVYRVGGTGSNFYQTVLNDSALVPIGSGTPPYVGQYRPSRPLTQFINSPLQGSWIIKIYDIAKIPTGVIKSWGITVTYLPYIGIGNSQDIIPDKCMLYQNYPNPFNPNTKIKFAIKNSEFSNQNSEVKLIVYDILGKEVNTLVNENLKGGAYDVQFSGNGLPSGIYFYSLYADGMIMDTKKMVLMK